MSKFFSLLTFFVFSTISLSAFSNDYYEILGISRTASPDEVKKAFRQKAKDAHPDLHSTSEKRKYEELFHKINDAKEVLLDPEKRKIYDGTLRTDSYAQEVHSAYNSRHYANVSTLTKFIIDAIASKNGLSDMRVASVNHKIPRALKLIHELIFRSKTLDKHKRDPKLYREIIDGLSDFWPRKGIMPDYHGDPTAFEAICKAAFLSLEKFKDVDPELYRHAFKFGYYSIAELHKIDAENKKTDRWAEATEEILKFANDQINKPTCNIF